jgi:hypothetical protein
MKKLQATNILEFWKGVITPGVTFMKTIGDTVWDKPTSELLSKQYS